MLTMLTVRGQTSYKVNKPGANQPSPRGEQPVGE